MTIEIITYWNVETLYYVLNAVASIMQSGHFTNMIRFIFLAALMVGIFSYGAAGKTLALATWFLQALLLTTLLNLPITTVLLTDKTAQEPPRTVANVPLALAIIAQGSTLVFSRLTEFYETTFGIPDALGLANGDVGFGHRILKQVNNIAIRDPGLRSDLMQFIKECTLYDLKDGSISSADLIGNATTGGYSPWTVMFSNTSPARFSSYNTLPGTTATLPVTAPCPDVAQVLALRVGDGIAAGQAFYGRTLFSRARTDAVAQGLFVNSMATSYDWILGNAQNASDAMKQAMFNNLWKDAGTELPTLLGDPSRVAEVSALMGAAQAAGQANASNSVLSQLAQENLPHIRNWIEAILYSLFPVVLLLAVFMSAQGAWKLLGGYVMALVWIGLWPLLFAIINGLSLLHLKHKMAGLNLVHNVPFQLSDVFDATLGDEQAAIGFMVVLVPFIAGAIVKMGQGGILSVADRMGASVSSAGASAGAAAAMGNQSLGQVGLDTAGINTTTMHKYDANVGLSGGGAAIGLASGGTLTMQGQHAARTEMLSRFASTMTLGTHRSASATQEAGTSVTASDGRLVSSQQSDAATLSNLHRKGASRSTVQSRDTSANVTEAGGQQGSAGEAVRRDRSYTDGAALNSSINATTGLAVGGHVGRTEAGGRVAMGGRGSTADADEKRLIGAMDRQGATPDQKAAALEKLRATKGGRDRLSPAGGSSVGLNAGLNNTNSASASQGLAKNASTAVGFSTSESTGSFSSTSGSVTQRQSSGQHGTQDQGTSRESTRTHVDGFSETKDAGIRNDSSAGDRTHRSVSRSAEQHRDLLADSGFMAQVAQRNNMSETRFYLQDTVDILRMVDNYVGEKGMLQQATAMPSQTLTGAAMATTRDAIQQSNADGQKTIVNATGAAAARNNRSVGVSANVGQPLAINMEAAQTLATSANAQIASDLAKTKSDAAPFVKHVQTWTNDGNPLGTGPVSTQKLAEDAVGKSIKSTLGNFWDFITFQEPKLNGVPLTKADQEPKAPPLFPAGDPRSGKDPQGPSQ